MAAKASAKLQTRSPAEFFADNRSIAGFDNPGKSLYTTVREFIENSLDAAEDMGQLPTVDIHIEQVPASEISDLYGDAARATQELAASLVKVETEAEAGKAKGPKSTGDSKKKIKTFYRVTVRDNGCGMPHDEIPNMLGRVLSGTKYTLKQARGRFGLGAKMTLIWSKMTTGRPLEVYTAREQQKFITHCSLDIDLRKNEPNVLVHEKLANDGTTARFPAQWRGTEISVTIEGNWSAGVGQSYKWKILRYLRLLAVIAPYAEFLFRFSDVDAGSKNNIAVRYRRRTDVIPIPPQEVKHHPSSIDLVIMSNLHHAAQESNIKLKQFLRSSFSNVDSAVADELILSLGDKFAADTAMSELTKPMLQHLVKILTAREWSEPTGDSLSPAGVYNLYLGVMKEIKPDMIATHVERAHVFQGHAFIVEAAVSLGGKTVEPGVNAYRFANRIPLLFEGGSDVITRTANELKWAQYKINKNEDRIGVFVSMVSTKIPFKGTGKEFISDEIPPIKEAIRIALQKCCSQLKAKITKRKHLQAQFDRKKSLSRYVPDVSKSLYNILRKMSELKDVYPTGTKHPADADEDGAGAQRDLVRKVQLKELTQQTIAAKLMTHVDQVDATEALEYVSRSGRGDASQAGKIYLSATTCEELLQLKAGELCMHFVPELRDDPPL